MKPSILFILAMAAMVQPVCFAAESGAVNPTIQGMEPVSSLSEIAPGVWKTVIGDISTEISYLQFADRPPRYEELRKFPAEPFPFDAGAIRFTISGDRNIGLRIPAPPGEHIYGFGLQLDGIRKKNTVLNLKVDHWGNGNGTTHAPVPFYVSSRGYGVFVNTVRPYKVYVQVGNRKDSPWLPRAVDRNPPPGEKTGSWNAQPLGDAVEFQTYAGGLEVYIIAGKSIQDVVAKYNLLNGGGALPPLWGLGFWHRVPAKYTAAQTEKEVAEFAERKIPLDVIGLEPGWMTKSYPCTFEWQKMRFPDPAGFTGKLLDKGIRLNLWENPYISPDAALYQPMLPYTGTHTVWLGTVPDYTMEQARELIAGQHEREHLNLGVSGYKTDEVDGFDKWLWPDHARFPSGLGGDVMRQIYGLAIQQTYQRRLYRRKNVRSMGLIRSSNGGASGYANAIYSDSYGHRQYITGISSAGLGGILWCPEIRSARNEKEWLCRMQTAAFSPLAQLNAWADGTKPWSHAKVEDQVRELIEWRMRLLPYLYTAYAHYNRKGVPPFRPMVMEAGYRVREEVREGKLDAADNPYETPQIVEVNDQYMMGPDILVAPFYESMSNQREVLLPPGEWYDFYTGKSVGSGKIKVVNEGKMPLFVRDGAVIPLLAGSELNTGAAYGKPLEIRYYGVKNGQADLYEDDGKTFDYERGGFRMRRFIVTRDGAGRKCREEIVEGDGPALFGPVATFRDMNRD